VCARHGHFGLFRLGEILSSPRCDVTFAQSKTEPFKFGIHIILASNHMLSLAWVLQSTPNRQHNVALFQDASGASIKRQAVVSFIKSQAYHFGWDPMNVGYSVRRFPRHSNSETGSDTYKRYIRLGETPVHSVAQLFARDQRTTLYVQSSQRYGASHQTDWFNLIFLQYLVLFQ
jgi:hypothetical protein